MEFASAGIRLHFEVHGRDGDPPIILVHGFASNYRLNWVGTRWQETLVNAGMKVIGLDCRGHGLSDKPHEPSAYSIEVMAADVIRLLDHLGLASTLYLGFSMGSRIGLQVIIDHPGRVRRAVLGGIGAGGATRDSAAIVSALLGKSPPVGRIAQTFFKFASATPGNDLEALAACMAGLDHPPSRAQLGAIRTPLLLVVGDRDDIAGDADELTELVPSSRLVTVAGRDHLGTVPARAFKEAAVEFLTEGLPSP